MNTNATPNSPLFQRAAGRGLDQLRPVRITRGYTIHAEGSVLIEFGNTRCCARPRWRKKYRLTNAERA